MLHLASDPNTRAQASKSDDGNCTDEGLVHDIIRLFSGCDPNVPKYYVDVGLLKEEEATIHGKAEAPQAVPQA